MTARKLNPEEENLFADALKTGQVSPLQSREEAVIKKLSAQRDAALVLSPELRLWFGVQQAVRFDY